MTLRWHLQANLYPPITERAIPLAEWAIERATAGDLDAAQAMPNGETLTAGQVMDDLHLWDFVGDDTASTEEAEA